MAMLSVLKNKTLKAVRWFNTPKKFIIALMAAVAIVFGVTKLLPTSSKAQYQTTQVAQGSIISSLSESGSISSKAQTTVNSPTDGIIEEVYVKNGDNVTTGQNLFKIKSTATPQEKASAYATYTSAVSAEKTSEQNKLSGDAQMWKDQQTLLDAQNAQNYKNNNTTNPSTKTGYTDLEKQSIDAALTAAQKQFSVSEQKYQQADVAITNAKAQLSSAWLSYAATQDSTVTAPIAGAIANFSATVGTNVAASQSNSTSTTSSSASTSTSSSSSTGVLVIGDFSDPVIKISASEIDAPRIKPDQKATITLDALPDKTFVANVDSIDTIGTISSGVVTYTAYLHLISSIPDIKPGMTATAIIQLDRHDNVLTVPTTAIQITNGQSYVRVLKNGTISPTPVQIGIADDTNTEITSGLTQGDIVVTTSTITPSTSSGTSTTSPFSGIGGRGIFGGGGGFGGGSGGGTRTGGARTGGGG